MKLAAKQYKDNMALLNEKENMMYDALIADPNSTRKLVNSIKKLPFGSLLGQGDKKGERRKQSLKVIAA